MVTQASGGPRCGESPSATRIGAPGVGGSPPQATRSRARASGPAAVGTGRGYRTPADGVLWSRPEKHHHRTWTEEPPMIENVTAETCVAFAVETEEMGAKLYQG